MREAEEDEGVGEEALLAPSIALAAGGAERKAHFKPGVHDYVVGGGGLDGSNTLQLMFPGQASLGGQWSAYGDTVDEEIFSAKLEGEDTLLNAESDKEKLTPAEAAEELPTKIEVFDLSIPVAATVKYIDFEGKSDGPSLRTIVGAMMPRSAIFVRGDREGLEEMKVEGAFVFLFLFFSLSNNVLNLSF